MPLSKVSISARILSAFLILTLVGGQTPAVSARPEPSRGTLRPQPDRSGLEDELNPVRPERVEGQSARAEVEEARIDETKLFNRSPYLLNAVRYFNREVINQPRLKWRHAMELFRRFRGERQDPELLRRRVGSLAAARLNVLNLINDDAIRGETEEGVISRASEIYSKIVFSKPLIWLPAFSGPLPARGSERNLTRASGHHRLGWFLMNYFLVRNGYKPFYFQDQKEVSRLHWIQLKKDGLKTLLRLRLEKRSHSVVAVEPVLPARSGLEEANQVGKAINGRGGDGAADAGLSGPDSRAPKPLLGELPWPNSQTRSHSFLFSPSIVTQPKSHSQKPGIQENADRENADPERLLTNKRAEHQPTQNNRSGVGQKSDQSSLLTRGQLSLSQDYQQFPPSSIQPTTHDNRHKSTTVPRAMQSISSPDRSGLEEVLSDQRSVLPIHVHFDPVKDPFLSGNWTGDIYAGDKSVGFVMIRIVGSTLFFQQLKVDSSEEGKGIAMGALERTLQFGFEKRAHDVDMGIINPEILRLLYHLQSYFERAVVTDDGIRGQATPLPLGEFYLHYDVGNKEKWPNRFFSVMWHFQGRLVSSIAGSEDSSLPAAGLEEAEDWQSPLRGASLAMEPSSRSTLTSLYRDQLRDGLLPWLKRLYQEVPLQDGRGQEVPWKVVEENLRLMVDGLVSMNSVNYGFLVQEGSLPDDESLYRTIQFHQMLDRSQQWLLASQLYDVMVQYARLQERENLSRAAIRSLRVQGIRRLVPLDWLEAFAEQREITLSRAWQHIRHHWADPEGTWPVGGQSDRSGLEESPAAQEPELLSRRESDGRMYVGDGRWIVPFLGADDYTKVLIETLRIPGMVRPEMEVLDLGIGDGAATVGIASKVRRVIGVDEDPTALAQAGTNFQLNGLANVELFRGDFFDLRVRARRYPLIVVNPPVLPLPLKAKGAFHPSAWRANYGGPDGRAVIDRILQKAPSLLAPAGSLLMVHPHFVDLRKTQRLAEELGLEVEVLLEKEVPILVPPDHVSLLLHFREAIRSAHGMDLFQKDGHPAYRLYVLKIHPKPARSGLEDKKGFEAGELVDDRPVFLQPIPPEGLDWDWKGEIFVEQNEAGVFHARRSGETLNLIDVRVSGHEGIGVGSVVAEAILHEGIRQGVRLFESNVLNPRMMRILYRNRRFFPEAQVTDHSPSPMIKNPVALREFFERYHVGNSTHWPEIYQSVHWFLEGSLVSPKEFFLPPEWEGMGEAWRVAQRLVHELDEEMRESDKLAEMMVEHEEGGRVEFVLGRPPADYLQIILEKVEGTLQITLEPHPGGERTDDIVIGESFRGGVLAMLGDFERNPRWKGKWEPTLEPKKHAKQTYRWVLPAGLEDREVAARRLDAALQVLFSHPAGVVSHWQVLGPSILRRYPFLAALNELSSYFVIDPGGDKTNAVVRELAAQPNVRRDGLVHYYGEADDVENFTRYAAQHEILFQPNPRMSANLSPAELLRQILSNLTDLTGYAVEQRLRDNVRNGGVTLEQLVRDLETLRGA